MTVIINHDYKISAASTDHTVPSLAFRIEEFNGSCITYSSDTRPSTNVANLARGCTLLIHETSGNPGAEDISHLHGHSTTSDAIKIAKNAGVRYLMPIHYYIDSPVFNDTQNVSVILPIPCTPIDIQRLK